MVKIFSWSEDREINVRKVIPVTMNESGDIATDKNGKKYYCTSFSEFEDDEWYYGLGDLNGEYVLYI